MCPTAAKAFADPLTAAAALLGIDTPLRQAAWLAQLIVESRGFARLEEGLYYTTPERICLMWPSRVHSLGRRRQALPPAPAAGQHGLQPAQRQRRRGQW